jgi:hypothetical protein
MARYREGSKSSGSDEWAIEPLITKINEARREVGWRWAG